MFKEMKFFLVKFCLKPIKNIWIITCLPQYPGFGQSQLTNKTVLIAWEILPELVNLGSLNLIPNC